MEEIRKEVRKERTNKPRRFRRKKSLRFIKTVRLEEFLLRLTDK